MKKYKYHVIYANGKKETFTCNGYREAIIKAMAKAYDMAWDSRIASITDERGETVENITVDTSYRFVNVQSK